MRFPNPRLILKSFDGYYLGEIAGSKKPLGPNHISLRNVIKPQACCAEVCVKTPFGKVCHCTLDLPICP